MSDIKFYLTSVEPNIAQTIDSQSIGGYPSTSLVYPETTLINSIGFYDISLTLQDYTGLSGLEYLNINSEIMQVRSIDSNAVSVLERGINNILNMHLASDPVRGVTIDKVFNNSFDDSYKQYRCIAIKNISDNPDPSADLVAYSMEVYFIQASRNPNDTIKLAIEVPNTQYIEGTSTSWTDITLTDTSLIGGDLEDNDCVDANIKILDGPNVGRNRIISSYDSTTGTFVFTESLPVDYVAPTTNTINYELEPSPAQRLKTGIESPSVGSGRISTFSAATENSPASINVTSSTNGANLYSRHVVYLWLERTLRKGSDVFDRNNIIIGLKYSTFSG